MAGALVSVIVPVHDGERFLAEAIESALAQDHAPLEVIVVDDGSTDRSADVAASYPVTLVRQPNRGVAEARNAGVRAARGELLAFLDADDVWVPHKISRQVAALEADPELGFVLARMEVALEPGSERPEWVPPEALRDDAPSAIPSALLVRRETFERVGPFDPQYPIATDADWLARAKDAGVRWARVEETLLRYRIHDANETSRREQVFGELFQVLRSSIRRQPLVTVVIPVRNNARFLGEAIESALAQTYARREIVVLDNASDDGSGDVARRYPVQYVRHEEDRGQAGSRNHGIELARGELIAFLDSDDRWTPDKLERQVAHLNEHPDVDYVLAHMRAVLDGVPKPGWLPADWLERCPGVLPGTLVARREAFERAGPFDPDFPVASDMEWFSRARDAGLRDAMLPEVLLLWRMHGANTSYRRDLIREELLRVMRRAVARKREAAPEAT